ncbi:Fic family protein [Novosphingobium malaysiense]|nr:Fic family protein [Novosphingobium malaysiense]
MTVHPFDEGNGRIARAIADRACAFKRIDTALLHSKHQNLRPVLFLTA